ncbi:MAG: hypothetical protein HY287_04085 [Planctomycetes bacterium]|nr:hypothetical protein [Planctomycetota bacterium]MBI3833493.1 hypothetical protein [Planctomycetota bacterium]
MKQFLKRMENYQALRSGMLFLWMPPIPCWGPGMPPPLAQLFIDILLLLAVFAAFSAF